LNGSCSLAEARPIPGIHGRIAGGREKRVGEVGVITSSIW